MKRLLTALILLSAVVHAQTTQPNEKKSAVPRFEDFKVSTPLPQRERAAFVARPELEPDAEFNRSLQDAAKEGPDFAGQYTVVRWGCGSNCAVLAVVNARTGKIYRFPFIAAGGVYIPPDHVISYRLNSSLLIITGTIDDEHCGKYYYNWNGARLSLLKTLPFPCNIDPDRPKP
ncbi:MAG TPA: hypothetical protein VNU44_05835 [Bryobacteraceae bacterium]|nr:hypothetical protein [Bryobacteraceae bacterium]